MFRAHKIPTAPVTVRQSINAPIKSNIALMHEKPLVERLFCCAKMYRFSYLSTKLIIRVNSDRFPRLRKLQRERTHLHTPLQKPVLLRLRLAASEKPVLNAPASACVAETS